MTETATERKVTAAEATLPSKPWYQSTELWTSLGLLLTGVIAILTKFGISVPFSADEIVTAVSSFVTAAAALYFLWKRIVKPVRLPIEGTKAAEGG